MSQMEQERVSGLARSLIAALADSAASWEAAADYDAALLALDTLTAGPPLPISPVEAAGSTRAALYRRARLTFEDLCAAGADAFEVGMCASMLATAWQREQPQ